MTVLRTFFSLFRSIYGIVLRQVTSQPCARNHICFKIGAWFGPVIKKHSRAKVKSSSIGRKDSTSSPAGTSSGIPKSFYGKRDTLAQTL